MDFQVITRVVGKKVFRTVLDEGASTSVLSLSCWKDIGSPELVISPMTMKYFDGWGFQPHGLIPALSVELGGKTVSIEVEVVDALLDYNLPLGRNWFYAMTAVASTAFQTIQFPHLGRIVTIDQINFYTLDFTTPMVNNIPMLGQSPPPYQSIGVGMLKDSSLMGIFSSNPPNTEMAMVNMISSSDYDPKGKQIVGSTLLSLLGHAP